MIVATTDTDGLRIIDDHLIQAHSRLQSVLFSHQRASLKKETFLQMLKRFLCPHLKLASFTAFICLCAIAMFIIQAMFSPVMPHGSLLQVDARAFTGLLVATQ